MIFSNALRHSMLLFTASLSAQVSKTLDLTSSPGKNTHYVVFASRGRSATGHSFVIWGVEDATRKRSTVEALGLYPEKSAPSCSALTSNVPGLLLDELATHSVEVVDRELIVRVDEVDFNRSLRVARRWGCSHEFSLLSHDCVEFLRAVGDSLNLPMPKRSFTRWTPQAYVRALLSSVREGKLEFAGAVYEGSIMNDLPVGQGRLATDDGAKIEGGFLGAIHNRGSGEFPACGGTLTYSGAVLDFQAHGKGVLGDQSGPALNGLFERGKLVKILHDYTPDRSYLRKKFRRLAECGSLDFERSLGQAF
jgi:hypothetical protein